MSLEAAIHALVTSDPAVGGIIGSRFVWGVLPQGYSLPAITCHEIGGAEEVTTDGPLGLVDSRWQFNCWAQIHSQCVALRDAVKSLFRANYSGTVAGIVIQGTRIVGRGEIPAIDEKAEQLNRYGRYLDVVISYEET